VAVSLILCDRSADMVAAWRAHFSDETGAKITRENILTVGADSLVVPSNAFGFTDGGIDVVVSGAIFNMGLQDRLRPLISERFAGELLVGQALVMPTGGERIRHIVVAPTMRVPEDASDTVNAYLAFRGALLAVEGHNRQASQADRIMTLAVPGLGTGVGKMPPGRAAYQMWMAYRTVALGDTEWSKALDKQTAMHKKMRERS
jgi:O-acetyl-ADP-ribose deacetylase (regulator of RNase III)